MQIAIITDIHFDVRDGSEYFLDKYEQFFSQQFFPHLLANNIKEVLCLGDSWENRRKLSVYAIDRARKMFYDKMVEYGIKFTTILGNHDVTFKNTNDFNSMSMFELAYENIKLVQEHEVVSFDGTKIALVSWINRDNFETQMQFIKTTDASIVGGHFEINDFEVSGGHKCETGLQRKVFKHFNQVWSGHFHTKQTLGNIHYLGNPFQTNFGDLGHARGFHCFDTETLELTFHKNEFEIYDAVEFDKDFDVLSFDYAPYANKIVVVNVRNLAEANRPKLQMFTDKLAMHCHTFTVNEYGDSVLLDGTVVNDVEMKDTREIINEYIDGAVAHSDLRDQVKKRIHDVYAAAISVAADHA